MLNFKKFLVQKRPFVGACNCCPNIKKCKLSKYFYYANVAQKNYEYTLKNAREGVNLNTTELYELAHIICPLIKQGQSIYTILQNHKEITQCEKTIYTYIEMGYSKIGVLLTLIYAEKLLEN